MAAAFCCIMMPRSRSSNRPVGGNAHGRRLMSRQPKETPGTDSVRLVFKRAKRVTNKTEWCGARSACASCPVIMARTMVIWTASDCATAKRTGTEIATAWATAVAIVNAPSGSVAQRAITTAIDHVGVWTSWSLWVPPAGLDAAIGQLLARGRGPPWPRRPVEPGPVRASTAAARRCGADL